MEAQYWQLGGGIMVVGIDDRARNLEWIFGCPDEVWGADIATLDTGEYTDDSEYYVKLPDSAGPARVADVIAACLTRPVARSGRLRRLVALDAGYGIGFAHDPEA